MLIPLALAAAAIGTLFVVQNQPRQTRQPEPEQNGYLPFVPQMTDSGAIVRGGSRAAGQVRSTYPETASLYALDVLNRNAGGRGMASSSPEFLTFLRDRARALEASYSTTAPLRPLEAPIQNPTIVGQPMLTYTPPPRSWIDGLISQLLAQTPNPAANAPGLTIAGSITQLITGQAPAPVTPPPASLGLPPIAAPGPTVNNLPPFPSAPIGVTPLPTIINPDTSPAQNETTFSNPNTSTIPIETVNGGTGIFLGGSNPAFGGISPAEINRAASGFFNDRPPLIVPEPSTVFAMDTVSLN